MRRGTSQLGALGLRPERGVLTAMLLLLAIWLVYRLGGEPVRALFVHLVLTPRRALGPEPWQLLTSGFCNLELEGMVFSAVSLLFFGNPLEQRFGAATFWKLFVAGAVGGALFAALLGRLIAPDALLAGTQPATTALLVGFGLLWGGQPVMAYGMAEMRASVMVWLFIGLSALMYLVHIGDDWRQSLLGLASLLGAALAGWLLVAASGGGSASQRGAGTSGASLLDRLRLWRLRRRYRVLTGGRDDGPGAGPGARNKDRYIN